MGDTSLYVSAPNLGINNLNSRKRDGILANVPIEVMPSEQIYYKPAEVQYFRSTSLLNVVEIEILDDLMQPIGSLNTGAGFRLTLSVHFSYNKEILLPPQDKTESIFKDSIENRKLKEEKK